MNDEHTESIVSLAKRRRLRRALEFLAVTMGATFDDTHPTPAHRFGDLKQLCGLPIDVAAVRAIGPKLRRELLAHVRAHQRSALMVHLRDPVEGIVEISNGIDLALYDVGVCVLDGLSLWTEGKGWWLVGRPGDVLFRLTKQGPVPTLTPPWTYAGISSADAGRQRWNGIAAAEQLFAAYVWTT
ncbi:MAG TPA: hypothetical protein VF614_00005 [Chthoniobacteraceae bacterium]